MQGVCGETSVDEGRNAFMDGNIAHDSPWLRARLAGLAYFITIGCGIFAEVAVRGSLVLPSDPAATARNILGAEQLYRLGFAADIVRLMSYVAVTALLYELLAPVNKSLSLLAAFFSLVGITTLAIGSLGHISALLLLQSPSEMATHSLAQLQAAAIFYLKLHGQAYNLSDVFFGVYCLVVGWLTAKSTFLPWVIGVLLMFAGACYLADSFATILAPRFERATSDYILLPGLVGEGGMALWLLAFGVDQSKWRSCG